MPRTLLSFTYSNPFYYKQIVAQQKTKAAQPKQWLLTEQLVIEMPKELLLSSFSLLLQIALGAVEPPCIMCVQYIGGVFNTSGDPVRTSEGYHDACWGIL